jgi:hypothetical protein
VRRALTILAMAVVATSAGAAFFVFFTAPPAALRLSGSLPDTIALGAYHVHSSRSDGSGSVDDIARAAADAGVRFVVFTDHGDGTRPPMPPAYVHGVLCIDAVEINTTNGHLVALGLDGAAPYPLAGDARDVIEDVHRLGGVAIAAHPDSPSPSLRWRGAARFDGLEWINADAEWRDNSASELVAAAARSMVRAPESLASLVERPTFTLQRWDAALRTRNVVGLAALDAHARVAADDDDWAGPAISWPSYAATFRTIAQAVVLDAPLTGHAEADARTVVDALIAGRGFSILTALAAPAHLEFHAEQGRARAGIGQTLDGWNDAAPTRVVARVPQAPGARLTLVAGGQIVSEGQGSIDLTRQLPAGAYRIEAVLPGSPRPWIVSNPIRLGAPADERPLDDPLPIEPSAGIPVPPDAAWTLEHDPHSTAALRLEPPVLRFDFALAGGTPSGQYSALAAAAPRDAGIDRVAFTASASAPMRVSVQVRLPGGSQGQRWRRSIYLDRTPRDVIVRLTDMEPAGETTTLRPIVARIQSLLFVVDTLNTAPGMSGTIWLRDVRLGVGAVEPLTSER